ncbi:MAG: hypothetical protein Q9168_004094 [Polycauliona sp. 1 TL-2023]
MSSNERISNNGFNSSEASSEMQPQARMVPEEASPKILKRKHKSGDLNFEKTWGGYLDEKVDQELHKLALDVRKEYTEGEPLPSEDAIALTQHAKTWSELRKDWRTKEKAKIRQRIASRDEFEREMESTNLVQLVADEGTILRSGRQVLGLGRI